MDAKTDKSLSFRRSPEQGLLKCPSGAVESHHCRKLYRSVNFSFQAYVRMKHSKTINISQYEKRFSVTKLYFVFAAVMAAGTICSAALIPSEVVKVEGVDVRNKDEKYLLTLSKENIVLEERSYKLMKIVNGGRKILVAQGDAVFSGSDLKNDTEALWVNDRAQIKIGRMVNSNNPKQVVVLKLKDTNRTFAFEMYPN